MSKFEKLYEEIMNEKKTSIDDKKTNRFSFKQNTSELDKQFKKEGLKPGIDYSWPSTDILKISYEAQSPEIIELIQKLRGTQQD